MGLLRILLLAIAILFGCLVILPKKTRENFLTSKAIKIIAAVCTILLLSISAAIYYWDLMLKDQESVNLISKKISVDSGTQATNLELSNYDLQNFSPTVILKVLAEQPQINTLSLKNVNASNLPQLTTILANNTTIKVLVINATETAIITDIIALLPKQQSLHTIILKRNKLRAKVLESLTAMLEQNQNIVNLSLEYANLGENEIPQITALILANTKIRNLSLAGNQFNSASLTALAKALQKNNVLQILKINIANPASNKDLFLQELKSTKLQIDFGN